jgi:lysophospholipase L1-like esterase
MLMANKSPTQKKIKLLNTIIVSLTVLLLAVMLGYVLPSMLADERTFVVSSKAALRKVRYNEENKTLEKGQVVFIGDSIFEFYDTAKFYPDHTVYNRGISGDRSNHVLARIEENALVLDPRIIVIHVGTNDIGAKLGYDLTLSNMKKIVEKIREHDASIKIILDNVYPINDENRFFYSRIYGVRENYQILELNRLLKDFSQENGVEYIDNYILLTDEAGRLKREYTVDGLHLSQKGYEVVTASILPYLEEQD